MAVNGGLPKVNLFFYLKLKLFQATPSCFPATVLHKTLFGQEVDEDKVVFPWLSSMAVLLLVTFR